MQHDATIAKMVPHMKMMRRRIMILMIMTYWMINHSISFSSVIMIVTYYDWQCMMKKVSLSPSLSATDWAGTQSWYGAVFHLKPSYPSASARFPFAKDSKDTPRSWRYKLSALPSNLAKLHRMSSGPVSTTDVHTVLMNPAKSNSKTPNLKLLNITAVLRGPARNSPQTTTNFEANRTSARRCSSSSLPYHSTPCRCACIR